MNLIGKRSLASVLHLGVTLALVGCLFVSFVVIGLTIYSGFVPPNNSIMIQFSVNAGPVKVDLGSRALSQVMAFPWVVSFLVFVLAPASMILLMLRRILTSLKLGEAFEARTPSRLRVIGWTVILSSAAESILLGFALPSISRMIGTASGIELHARLDTTSMFLGLVLLVLAEIFKIGVRLRLESELTV